MTIFFDKMADGMQGARIQIHWSLIFSCYKSMLKRDLFLQRNYHLIFQKKYYKSL
jgi:hypothetical protein